jgi:transcriptional regulator with XRE-family HTH domain
MRFVNFRIAVAERRLAQYELAALLRMSDATFSRKLSGRAEFLPHERQCLAEFLGFDAAWLFAEITPPASARLTVVRHGCVHETAALCGAGEIR